MAFLPAAGLRVEDAEVAYVQLGGVYWASTASIESEAYTMYFFFEGKDRIVDVNERCYGLSVRLVRDEELKVKSEE